ncbi:MAG TPA: DEAD/DEAH box helicase, partial [Gemmatimonadales bacterium]|nr:DEAD/DEAH box helicase [Gemmatimonadales bacterium]
MQTGRFAEVAVNSGQPVRAGFTYSVPDSMQVVPGQSVFVPYGPRVLQGLVLDLLPETDLDQVRPIDAIADPQPVLDETHIALARWLSATYLAPLWDCVAVSLPPGYGQKSVTMVSPVEVPPLLPVYPKDRKILAYLGSHGQVTIDALREAVGAVSMPTLARLQEAGHLTVAQGLTRPAGRPKIERRVQILRPAPAAFAEADELAGQNKRVLARLLRRLAEANDLTLKELRELGATPAHLARLAEDGWVREYEARIERDPIGSREFREASALALTPDQRDAADRIAASPGEVHLLHGVTGSGKTEVYVDLVQRTLAAGKGAMLLVPEISLTPQAIRRYGERFGDELAVVHSQLGTGELYDQWYRIQRGEVRVVLGSRSAVFAPVRDVGLIVIDEEQRFG